MSLPRRSFLKSVLATGGAMALGATVLPTAVMADWPKAAFEAKSIEEALMALFESDEVTESDQITIEVPEIAENGAVVPIKVEVSANLPNIESVAVIAEKNPVPLVAQFNFPEPENFTGWLKTRIKMGETSEVVVVAKADGKLYVARRNVKVTIGGCGG
jgi:sulfur-oxidizing protein SoxY